MSKSQVARSSPIVKKQYIQLSNQGITNVQKICTWKENKQLDFDYFTVFWRGGGVGMLLGVVLYK